MQRTSKFNTALVFFLALTAATLAIYLPGLSNGLVFDDNRLLDGTVFDHFGSLLNLKPRMLSYGSFVWLQPLAGEHWGLQRVFNVLLHLGVTAGLYVLFQQLFRHTRFSEEALADPGHEASWQAGLRVGTALYALNPMAVYAVAYLLQRSMLMATLFVVWACVAWVRGVAERRKSLMVLALVSYVLAVLSKETVFMAAALAAPLYIFVARPPMRRVLAIAGGSLVALVLVSLVLYPVFGSLIGVAFDPRSVQFQRQLEQIAPGIGSRIFPLSMLNQATLFFQYGFLWLFPNVQWMSIDLRPPFPLSFTSFPHILGGIGYVVVLLGSAWLVLRRSDLLGLAALCVLCPALLFIAEFATVWVQDPFVLYRSYVWALTLPGLIAIPFIGFKPKLIHTVGIVLALVFAGLAVERVWSLRDELTAWSDAIEKTEHYDEPNAVGRWRPYLNRGAYYLDKERIREAYADFVRANQLGEPEGMARFNMGMALQLEKKHEAALAELQRAEAMGYAEPHLQFVRGESQYQLARFAEAYASFDKALASGQKLPKLVQDRARRRRAESAIPLQKFDVAVADLEALLKDKPNDQALLLRLAMAQVGRKDAAAAMAAVNRMRPSGAAFYARAMTFMVSGERAKALADLDMAISLEPGNAAYRNVRTQIAMQATAPAK